MLNHAENLLAIVRRATKNPLAFSKESMLRFLEMGRVSYHVGNTTLIARASRVQTLFIPLSASIYAYADHDETPVELFDQGDLVALPHALTSTPYPYKVATKIDTEILSVPFSHIRSLIDHDVNLRWQVIDFISQNIMARDFNAQRVISADPAKRLAQALLEISSDYGVETSRGTSIETKLSQEELGARIGASRQTVNKYIREFVELGLIEKNGHKYSVRSTNVLLDFIQSK